MFLSGGEVILMNKKSGIINGVIIVLSVIVLMAYIIFVDGLDNILSAFSNCRVEWLFVGVVAMIGYWYLEGHVLNKGLGIFNRKLSIKYSMKNCMIGQFFNSITPSATGGQPIQAYYLNRCGIEYGFATSALLLRFISFQFSLTFVCIIVMIFKFNEYASQIQGFTALMLIGFTINTFVAIGLILIGFNKKIALIIMRFFVKILGRLRILKNVDKKLELVDDEVDLFSKGFSTVLDNKKVIIKMFFLSVVQIILFYFVNVIISLSFGISIDFQSAFHIISGAACVQMSSTFIPLPGAAGGAELSYYVIYGSVFEAGQLSVAVLLWRMYTFYMPIVVGLFFSKDLFGKKFDKSFSFKQ